MKLFRPFLPIHLLFGRRIWRIPNDENTVYLTFDDGPTPELTDFILNCLEDANAKATFFCVGENAKNHPELMERIRQEGHVVGNHTMRHEKGTKTASDIYFSSIREAEEFTSKTLFRPPYGRMPLAYDAKLKGYKIIMWSWLSYDYDKEVPIETILRKAKEIKSGDIIVLHDNLKVDERLKIILPALLQILDKKGLKSKAIFA